MTYNARVNWNKPNNKTTTFYTHGEHYVEQTVYICCWKKPLHSNFITTCWGELVGGVPKIIMSSNDEQSE